MNVTHYAILNWLPADKGGRQSPPAGPTYSTVAHFAEDESRPHAAWTLVLRFIHCTQDCASVYAAVQFLSDDAPVRLLHEGSQFELFEGPRRVAVGVVVVAGEAVDEAARQARPVASA